MNNDEFYIYAITALLPLTACMLVFQVNPYHALVIRGILGAIAALVYALLGAADVALTEALVGTMLAITLYAVAVRSSLVMRLGVLKDELSAEGKCSFGKLLDELRTILSKRHMRLEVCPYTDPQSLDQALVDKEIHTTCLRRSQLHSKNQTETDETQLYHTVTRVQRLYEIMQSELASSQTLLTYVNLSDSKEKPS
jgi:putative multicomponent Na+:H+ antiporter subunit B